MKVWKMIFLFKQVIFMFSAVNFQGCMFLKSASPNKNSPSDHSQEYDQLAEVIQLDVYADNLPALQLQLGRIFTDLFFG